MALIESPMDELGNIIQKSVADDPFSTISLSSAENNHPQTRDFHHHHHIYHHHERGVDVVQVTDQVDLANNNTHQELVDPDDETIVIVDSVTSTVAEVTMDNNITMPNPPSSMRLAELNPNTQFSGQRFYGTMGGWVPHLLGSCFRPMWNNIFSSQNDPCLTSDSSDADNFEISLEQIDVNFKENYIGGGNQSSVFRGKFNGRFIALKKLNRASEVDINTLKGLDHPNVIKTLGICTRDLYPMIIMEYCEKGGLFDVLHQIEVSKAIFLQWAGEIVEGMKYLHSRKIVHRDLKSPNILVDANDCLKICDFGSLYAWEKTFMPSVVMSVCGTSQWMSPEMLKNEPCNEKVDVWSFGVVLWELLTQEVPYKNISPMAIMYGVGSGQLNLRIPKAVPTVIETLLCNCWSKRPRNRPSFASIFTHLANLRVEIGDMSEDAWQMRRGVWRREICDENAKRCVLTDNAKDGAKEEAEELVVKRRHELRHLQELRTLYERKTQRAEKYTKEVFAFYDDIRRYEAELIQREYELFGENRIRQNLPGRRISPNFSNMSNSCGAPPTLATDYAGGRRVPSSCGNSTSNAAGAQMSERVRVLQKGRGGARLVKVEKSTITAANSSSNSRCLQKHNDSHSKFDNIFYSCGNSGRLAVVTLSVDDDNDAFNNNIRDNDTINHTTARELNVQNNNGNGGNQPDDDEFLISGNLRKLSACANSGHLHRPHGDNEGGNEEDSTEEPLSSSASSSIKEGSDEEGEDEIVFQNHQNTRRQREISSERLQYSQQCVTVNNLNPATVNPAMASLNAAVATSANSQNYREFTTTCPCCQHQFFNRNSLARASNMSSDSGFSHLEELPHPSNNNNDSFSNVSTVIADLSASNSANFYANRSVSGNFERYSSKKGGGLSRMSASNLRNSTNLPSESAAKAQPRDRPIHIGAIGRAGGISNASISSRGLTTTRQSGSYSFDESCSECGSQYHHLYRNEQGRWSEGRVQQRSRRMPRPASYMSPGMMNSVHENPIHPSANAPRPTHLNFHSENLPPTASFTKGKTSPTRRSLRSASNLALYSATNSNIEERLKAECKIPHQNAATKFPPQYTASNSANLTTVDSGISYEIVDYSVADGASRYSSTKALHSGSEKSKLPRRISSTKEAPRISTGTQQHIRTTETSGSVIKNERSAQIERAVDVADDGTHGKVGGSKPKSVQTPPTFRRQSSSRMIRYRSPKIDAFSRRSTSSQSLTTTSALAARRSIPRVAALRNDDEPSTGSVRQRPTVSIAKSAGKKESSSNCSSPSKFLHDRLVARDSVDGKMIESSATTSMSAGSMMASSELERSLEAAAAISDGLSDKEHKLRAAKSSFKTHRRTASNPLHLPPSCNHRPATVCETSTESDNDPVYC